MRIATARSTADKANSGVSVGAINSTYQKTRVENVCKRLGLTPLCYLWEKDQTELFDGMVRAGVDAIVIKVASAGLTSKHLGMTLKEVLLCVATNHWRTTCAL